MFSENKRYYANTHSKHVNPKIDQYLTFKTVLDITQKQNKEETNPSWQNAKFLWVQLPIYSKEFRALYRENMIWEVRFSEKSCFLKIKRSSVNNNGKMSTLKLTNS